jgi:hypothetical protein
MDIITIRHVVACHINTNEGSFYQIGNNFYSAEAVANLEPVVPDVVDIIQSEYALWRRAFQKQCDTQACTGDIMTIRDKYHSQGLSVNYKGSGE